MRLFLKLSQGEIQERIPYTHVRDTMSSSIWNTGKRKRLMKEYFTESEIVAVRRLYRQAHSWHLVRGVPEEITMSFSTLNLWDKLANFCCQL